MTLMLADRHMPKESTRAICAGGGESQPSEDANGAAQQSTPTPPAGQAAEPMAVDEDDLLQQALAMSMAAGPMETDGPAPDAQAAPAEGSMFDGYDEELQNAIRMSMSEVQPGEAAAPSQVAPLE